jgi:hypothetical protein
MDDYYKFLDSKRQLSGEFGFNPIYMPDQAFDFQKSLIEWSCLKGRSAIFADCGLGKSLMQLAWAQNVVQKTNKNVLILTPLAVSHQTVKEGAKFGIECAKSSDGNVKSKVTVTNYERLHYFDASDFAGVVCDESSILKNYSGKIRSQVTDFLNPVKYRLLCTATAAPNDWMELGTSSEALGYLKRVEMLANYFSHDGGDTSKWRIKGHAAGVRFWEWVSSWAKAVRRPSDLGFSDEGYDLPMLKVRSHVVESTNKLDGFLFSVPAVTLDEQREERRSTIESRCEMVKTLTDYQNQSIAWCHLNSESEYLKRIIPGSVEVKGSSTEDEKEESFENFESGKIKVLITKPSIAGFGLNWQNCNHMTFFPSHSFEQWYQSIRRCYRFGQKKDVLVDVVSSESESNVYDNLQRKQRQAAEMFDKMIGHMNPKKRTNKTTKKETIQLPSFV